MSLTVWLKKLDQKAISASRYKSYIDLHFESKNIDKIWEWLFKE